MNNRIRWLARIVGVATLGVSSAAQAISPVTKEQSLCSGPYIFTGRVLSVVNKDCRLTKSAAQCSSAQRNTIQLEVVVTRIVGVHPELLRNPAITALRVGQTITPTTGAKTSPHYNGAYDDWSGPNFKAPYDALLSDEWLSLAYVGRELLFSGGSSSVSSWGLDRLRWAQETMASFTRTPGFCHTPL